MIEFPTALEWVVGVDWPEGDEDKMFALADGWHRAGIELKAVAEQLDALKRMIERAYPQGVGSGSILDNYQSVRDYLDDLSGKYQGVGKAAKATGADIEAAKIEMCIALVALAAELIASVAAGPFKPLVDAGLIAATRVILAVLRRSLLNLMTRNGAKALANKAFRDLAKHAGMKFAEAQGKQGLKQVGKNALKEAGKEIGQELAETYGTKAYQVAVDHRDSSELTDWTDPKNLKELGLTVAGAGAGGFAGSLAGKGFTQLPGVDLNSKGVRGALTGLGAGAVAGAAGDAAGAVVPAVIQHGFDVDKWNIDPKSIVGGAVSGGLPGAVRGARGTTPDFGRFDTQQRNDGSSPPTDFRSLDDPGAETRTSDPATEQRDRAVAEETGGSAPSRAQVSAQSSGETHTAPVISGGPSVSEPAPSASSTTDPLVGDAMSSYPDGTPVDETARPSPEPTVDTHVRPDMPASSERSTTTLSTGVGPSPEPVVAAAPSVGTDASTTVTTSILDQGTPQAPAALDAPPSQEVQAAPQASAGASVEPGNSPVTSSSTEAGPVAPVAQSNPMAAAVSPSSATPPANMSVPSSRTPATADSVPPSRAIPTDTRTRPPTRHGPAGVPAHQTVSGDPVPAAGLPRKVDDRANIVAGQRNELDSQNVDHANSTGVAPDVAFTERLVADQDDRTLLHTGGAIRPRDVTREFEWAEEAYDRFRASDHDIDDIAGNLAHHPRADGSTFSRAEVAQIKEHLFLEPHPILDYDGNRVSTLFDAHPGIAEAWIRLRRGAPLPADIVLLEHELAESRHMRAHPELSYQEAHAEANLAYPWERDIPSRTGERYDTLWGAKDGTAAVLQPDQERPDRGGVPVRAEQGEPRAHPDHRQDEPHRSDRPTGGRDLPHGGGADHASGEARERVAAERRDQLVRSPRPAGDGSAPHPNERAPEAYGGTVDYGDFRGDAHALVNVYDSTVRESIERQSSLLAPQGISWRDHDKVFVMTDGRTIAIRVANRPLRGMVADFRRRRDDSGYDVEISPGARIEDVGQAVAHELETIQLIQNPSVVRDSVDERPPRITAHLGGRFGELRWLDARIALAMADADAPAELPRLRQRLADLMRLLGLGRGSGCTDRWQLLIDHNPELAGRLEGHLRDEPPPARPLSPGETATHGQRSASYSDTRALNAFRVALDDAARAACAGTGRTMLDEIQQFTLQRVLSRIFTDNASAWVLKGGQSMLARIPDARPSNDIDLVRVDGADQETMVREYSRALGRDHGDHLRFVFESKVDLDSGGVRLFHKAFLGDWEVMTFGIDLNPERSSRVDGVDRVFPMHATPEIVDFPEQILRSARMGAEPQLRLLAVQDTLAHKVAGMYTYGIGTAKVCGECVLVPERGFYRCKLAGEELPYRPQDLADLLQLAAHSSFDGATTQAIVRKEIEWRLSNKQPLHVPTKFEVPNERWTNWFAERLPSIDALPFRTLAEAKPFADDFLSPLLGLEPLHGVWDPQRRRWLSEVVVHSNETVAPESVVSATVAEPPKGVRWVEGTGIAVPSTAHAEPDRIAQWDQLAGRGGRTHTLSAQIEQILTDSESTIPEKLSALRQQFRLAGDDPSEITGMDDKRLRFYSHQSGELHIHTMALVTDPDTTVEIAFQPARAFTVTRSEAYQSHIAYLGALPHGMHADQANAVAFSRWARGLPAQDLTPTVLVRELLELHAQPLRTALEMRRRLIEEFSVDPRRIRLVYAKAGRNLTYRTTRFLRAHLFTLDALRDHPIESRQAIEDAALGPDPAVAAERAGRAKAVMDRLLSVHEREGMGPQKYTLMWIRDSRPYGEHGPEMDTRPQFVRQQIEWQREKQPDRRIVFVGDDLFAGRAALRAQWERAGVLADVDTSTLVKYWAADRNGGKKLTHGEQVLFFRRLGTERDVVQIGMESGALEIPAILGIPTVYSSAKEFEGGKANRWSHYFETVQYGRHILLTDPTTGQTLYDTESGLPMSEFRPSGEPRPPSIKTIERVSVGPDLPDPTNRRSRPVAVFRFARVSLTTSRIVRLIETGELDNWSRRLGRSVGLEDRRWARWGEQDWHKSRDYADQLNRWLHTPTATPEQVTVKWDAIRLALKGIVEPGYTRDTLSFGSSTVVHPYFPLVSDHRAPADTVRRIAEAYASPPDGRAGAVVAALQEMFRAAAVEDQAAQALSAFGLEPKELRHGHISLDRVVSRNAVFKIAPYFAPPGGCAWDAPGVSTHTRVPPRDTLHVPDYIRTYILEGDPKGGGGHRFGRGRPGKSEFPQRWDDDAVVRHVLEVAAAPVRVRYQANGCWNVIGTVDDVTVSAIILASGAIRSAWPEHGRGVFRNPRPDR
ncbi:EndoU domain-containing protein [Nocardia brasiliensis]|uniref:WXG100-like domain-containing protein n=1 Tax=Nocardia brasiliensis TaxID=37326 RepID=UPI0033F5F756